MLSTNYQVYYMQDCIENFNANGQEEEDGFFFCVFCVETALGLLLSVGMAMARCLEDREPKRAKCKVENETNSAAHSREHVCSLQYRTPLPHNAGRNSASKEM
ncbi:unnamed protein product [Gongylonema pulchrum]|uniref:Uncharacterized protein n=1 Tax=Gongylonema pulchrum TaxID=637853 RepID=A0A183DSP0_9BILA|nr:unnamed protein product [Gongylonema pulchrum]